jgi:hypothetical protein
MKCGVPKASSSFFGTQICVCVCVSECVCVFVCSFRPFSDFESEREKKGDTYWYHTKYSVVFVCVAGFHLYVTSLWLVVVG